MLYKYAHPEFYSSCEKIDFSQYSGRLVLYGAGRIGGICAHALKKRGVEFLCFVDRAQDKQGQNYFGHPVISPEELREKYSDAPILISCLQVLTIEPMLRSWGYSEILSAVTLLLEIDFDGFEGIETVEYSMRNVNQWFKSVYHYDLNTDYLMSLNISVTNRCTLRCKECSTFVPYIDNAQDQDTDTIIDCISKFAGMFKGIGYLGLLGGEPFCHKDIAKIIKAACSFKEIESVQIISNATVVPDKESIDALKNPKALLRLSNYGRLSRHLDDIMTICEKENIRVENTNYTHWNKNSEIKIFNETINEIKNKFMDCTACLPMIVFGTKASFCPVGAMWPTIGAIPDMGNNYIDLAKHDNLEILKQDIMRFFNRIYSGDYIDACKYCSGNVTLNEMIPVAEQTRELLTFNKLI